MLPKQIAVLLFRLFAIYLFFDCMIILTELPSTIYNMCNTRVDYMKPEYALIMAMQLVRLFIYLVSAICFLVFAKPLANFFTKDLNEQ
jgi:hypothetical protein